MTDYFKILESIKPYNDSLPLIPDYLPEPNYQVGEILNGQNEILDRLHGSAGDVYHCKDQKRKKEVAIKTIIGQEKSSRGRLQEFMEEAKNRIALPPHPNVVAFERILEMDGYYYIVSEWITGSEQYGNTLTSWIRSHRFDQKEFVNALLQICYGLLHCYDNIPGFIFGDLKPDNILITDDGIYKLADFSGGYTTKWASPEQQCGDVVDKLSDIYSFSMVAFEIQNVTKLENIEMDEDISQLLCMCNEEVPSDRPQTIRIVVDELLKICNKYGIASYSPNEAKLSFRDNFNRYAAEDKIYGENRKAISPKQYNFMSFTLKKGIISLDEYAEYVSSEDKEISEAHKLEREGKFQEALSVLTSSIKTTKKSNSVYLERARLFKLTGNVNDAIKNYDAAILNGDSLEAYDLKANILLDYPQLVGDHPEIPILIERLDNLPKERYIGYLGNQARAKYYMLSGLYQYASSYFRKSLQYPNEDEWLTLFYYGLSEKYQKHIDNSNVLFAAACEQIESVEYLSNYEKCMKLLMSYWHLKRKGKVEYLAQHIQQKYQIDCSSYFNSI